MGSIGIRRLLVTDPPVFEAAFAAQGWQKAAAQYERYLALQESGERDVLVATTDGAFAGYLTIGWESRRSWISTCCKNTSGRAWERR
jgi:hypothetical protein